MFIIYTSGDPWKIHDEIADVNDTNLELFDVNVMLWWL